MSLGMPNTPGRALIPREQLPKPQPAAGTVPNTVPSEGIQEFYQHWADSQHSKGKSHQFLGVRAEFHSLLSQGKKSLKLLCVPLQTNGEKQ